MWKVRCGDSIGKAPPEVVVGGGLEQARRRISYVLQKPCHS